MPLTVVNVAYPLAPVGPDAVGGAEQIVHLLDRHLVEAGHRSIVVGCEGSRTAGHLVGTPLPSGRLDASAHLQAIRSHQCALDAALARWPVDVVHVHGHDFDSYLPAGDVPVLATVHLPPSLLVADLARIRRPAFWAHGVSHAQQRRLPQLPCLLPPIENGVAVRTLARPVRRRGYALALGRICPEKGFHLALEAARRAGTPMLLGGCVFRYDTHEHYFQHEIVPRLARDRRFLGPVALRRKRRLLSAARCLLVPSIAEETSSLVAMEALACGTPVIAFASGALPEIVEHGVTGFIVRDVGEMAEAIRRAERVDREACRAAARARFSCERMLEQYVERYQRIVSWSPQPPAPEQTPCTSHADLAGGSGSASAGMGSRP